MLRELHQLRDTLIGEARQFDDETMARTDTLLAEHRARGSAS